MFRFGGGLVVTWRKIRSYAKRHLIFRIMKSGPKGQHILFDESHTWPDNFLVLKNIDAEYFTSVLHPRDRFLESHAFNSRYLVRGSNVSVDTITGVVSLENGNFLVESSSWCKQDLELNVVHKSRNFGRVITSNADNSLLPSNGFYHWLLEDLPLYLKLQKVKRQEGILFNTFVYNGAPKYVIDFLNWMGVDVKFLPRLASFGELDFITRGDDAGWPRCEDVEILRDTFSPLFHPKKPTKKIYIPRTKASRSPSYEIELTNILAANDWTILYPETQSLIEQIQIISEAEVLCGVHGAGLAGMIWMEGSAKVIEISRETLGRACFARLANICGLNYFWISDMSKNVDELFEVISKLSEPETMGN